VSGTLDTVLVAGLVTLAVVYAVLALGPKAWRHTLARGVAGQLERVCPPLPLMVLVRWLRHAPAASGACGGCEGCAEGAADTNEVKVPVAKIGRRR
jgi:hypothetical protein